MTYSITTRYGYVSYDIRLSATVLSAIMLSVIMLSVIMLSVIILSAIVMSVIVLIVIAPFFFKQPIKAKSNSHENCSSKLNTQTFPRCQNRKFK